MRSFIAELLSERLGRRAQRRRRAHEALVDLVQCIRKHIAQFAGSTQNDVNRWPPDQTPLRDYTVQSFDQNIVEDRRIVKIQTYLENLYCIFKKNKYFFESFFVFICVLLINLLRSNFIIVRIQTNTGDEELNHKINILTCLTCRTTREWPRWIEHNLFSSHSLHLERSQIKHYSNPLL